MHEIESLTAEERAIYRRISRRGFMGATASQFENHIRAVCGLPLGDPARIGPRVTMGNLIGAEVDDWAAILAEPGAHLHLYGKDEARPGRKMGHVTRLG